MTKHINKIEKLITQLCPNGVKYKSLGEIGTFVRGSGLQKAEFTETGVGCIHYGQIYTSYGLFTKKTKSFVSPGLADKLKKVQNGNLIIACTSENIKDVCKSVVWLGDEDIVTGGHSTIFKHNENPLYVAYFFQSRIFFDQKTKYAKGTKVIEISAKDLAKIVIPIPPLIIQEEIVKILNSFMELKVKLEVELKAREKQYEYYREDLLINKNGSEIKYVTIKDITLDSFWIMPSTPSFLPDGEVPYITSKNIRNSHINFSDVKYISRSDYLEISKNRPIIENDILISMIGTIGEVALVKKTDLDFYGQNMFLVRLNSRMINFSYFLHFFDSARMKQYFNSIKNNSGQGYLKSKHIDSIQIPLPTLPVQVRIASILDKFNALVNDTSIGLPAELKARTQQYEYYRNKLLAFKEYVG